MDELWWPAIGALGLGIIGYFVPRVLGVGYDTISDVLNANLAWKLLIVVMVAKAIALVISLGSGTSGGLLAPMFMSSAALGGVFALGIDRVFPAANLSAGAFALVAMGAVFGAASRATFTFNTQSSVMPVLVLMPNPGCVWARVWRRVSIRGDFNRHTTRVCPAAMEREREGFLARGKRRQKKGGGAKFRSLQRFPEPEEITPTLWPWQPSQQFRDPRQIRVYNMADRVVTHTQHPRYKVAE